MKRFLLLFALLLPTTAHAELSRLFFACPFLHTSSTRYCHTTIGPEEQRRAFIVPQALRAKAMRVTCDQAINTGKFTFTLRVQGASVMEDTTTSCCVGVGCTSATSCTINTETVDIDAGDAVALKAVPSSSPVVNPDCFVDLRLIDQDDTAANWIKTYGTISPQTITAGRFGGPGTNTANFALDFHATTGIKAALTITAGQTLTSWAGTMVPAGSTTGSVVRKICKLAVGDGSCDSAANGDTGLGGSFNQASSGTGAPLLLRVTDTTCTDNCSGPGDYVERIYSTTCSGTCSGREMSGTLMGSGPQPIGWCNGYINQTRYVAPFEEGGNKGSQVVQLTTGGTISNFRCNTSANLTSNVTFSSCHGNSTTPACSTTVRCQIASGQSTCTSSDSEPLDDDDHLTFQISTATGLASGDNICCYVNLDTSVADTPTPTPTPTITHTPTQTPTDTPTATFTPTPTFTPTNTPTETPVILPTPTNPSPHALTVHLPFRSARAVSGACSMTGSHGGTVIPSCSGNGAGVFYVGPFVTGYHTAPTIAFQMNVVPRDVVSAPDDKVLSEVVCTVVDDGADPMTTDPAALSYNTTVSSVSFDLGDNPSCGDNAECRSQWSERTVARALWSQKNNAACGTGCNRKLAYCRVTDADGANRFELAHEYSFMTIQIEP